MQTEKQIPSLIEVYSLFLTSPHNKIRTLTLLLAVIFTFNIVAQTPQWNFMGLAGEEIYDIAIDDSGYVYIGSDGGVFKSTDNGVTWMFKNDGLEIARVNKIFIDYERNIYLGAIGFSNTGCGLYKSTDGGEYWSKIADTLNNKPVNTFYDVTIIPNEPGGIIYVSNYYGVYRSTDNGITWQSTNFTDPGARNIGINTNGYMFFGNAFASWFGIYRSTDLGLTWIRHTFLSVELSMIYLRDGSILAGCYDPGLGEFGIYKTTDNGNFWFNTNTFSGLISFPDFVLDTNDDIYVSAGHTFLSTNNGIFWLDYGLAGEGSYYLAIDLSGYIWAGNHLDGVYRTAGRTVPVEFVSFTAEVINNNIMLRWITATETNNRGFEIEKSSDKKKWFNISFIQGKGTTKDINHYSFIDNEINSEIQFYRLKQIDYNGSFEYSEIIEVNTGLTITQYNLYQNYPNPFNSSTVIIYQVPEKSLINISLYDIKGERILKLVNDEKEKGLYKAELENVKLPSGMYLARMITNTGYSAIIKLLLIK